MKKVISLCIVLVLCLSLAAPAFATESGFVPSITYKPDPEIIPVEDEKGEEAIGVIRDENGEIIDYVYHGCLQIIPIAHVWDPEKIVPQEVEKLLTFVYEGLNDNSLAIPYDKFDADLNAADMVIRDLFDARWVCEEHREMIEKEGVTLEIIFDLGILADVEIYVATFDEATNTWEPIVKTVNNGDGTVTCTFEHLCAISFSMLSTKADAPVDDAQSFDLLPWIIALVVAVVGVVVIVIIKKKKAA